MTGHVKRKRRDTFHPIDLCAERLHQPGIEPGSVPWQGTILPLDHWCYPYI
ncbi:hypothetical protein N665_0185s0067 [Sinapis alba]|nr:hypothetical protein N665_0185s0067 [Sinapis alba]